MGLLQWLFGSAKKDRGPERSWRRQSRIAKAALRSWLPPKRERHLSKAKRRALVHRGLGEK